MTDINEWELSYAMITGPLVNLVFGTLASGYPFTDQMEIGDFTRQTVDTQHGTDDATLMGRDLAGGFDLTFSLTTTGDGADRINDALDQVSLFANVWRAQAVAHTPGAYAELSNHERGRFVRGRPRNFSRKHGRMRKGVVEYIAQFQTISPEFYDSIETLLTPPRTVDTIFDIPGDTATWPIIIFTGPLDTANLRWNPGPLLPQWNIGLSHHLNNGEQVTIDTAPWSRSATYSIGNAPVNGWLTGSKRSDCFLNPSVGGKFLFTTTGATNANTKCEVKYNAAYAGL